MKHKSVKPRYISHFRYFTGIRLHPLMFKYNTFSAILLKKLTHVNLSLGDAYKSQLPFIRINSTAVERCWEAWAASLSPFQTGFTNCSQHRRCILFLFTSSPTSPQSKLYTVWWTITCSEMFHGQTAAFSCDKRLRMAEGFSHMSSQVFLTGGGLHGSRSSTPTLTTSKWSLSSRQHSLRHIIQGANAEDILMQQARSKSILTSQARTVQLTSEVKVVNGYTLSLSECLFSDCC